MRYHVTLVTDGTPFFLYHGAMIGMENAHLSNFNIIPLVALILATPRITPERSVKILAVGIFLLFCLHVTDFVSHFPMYFRDSGIAALVGLLGIIGTHAIMKRR